ncbi:MAG: SRPBCC domain-containing protein [Phycisphaerae bacterium]|nr:SRPBCC domain-containing protein [Phycisphaerae bacterium]
METAHKLKVTTPTDLEIVMTRVFDSPRHLVWNAMTQPDLVRRWMFMPPGWNWAECEMDVRVGGKFRWAWSGPDGQLALTIWGEHREVSPPAKIVHTERMEMGPGGGCGAGDSSGDPWELLATLELLEQGGKTHLKMTLLFPTKEGRDGALASGMEHGVAAGYDALDGILANCK